jgi:hypothetical protein
MSSNIDERMQKAGTFFLNPQILKIVCSQSPSFFIFYFPAFCVPSSMFELKPYKNSFKTCHQLTDKKVEEKMS